MGGGILDTKPDFKPDLQAEYSMWGLDYERLNEWIKWSNYWSAKINSKDYGTIDELQNYFSALNILYGELRELISFKKTKTDYDTAFKTCKEIKRRLEKQREQGVPVSKTLTIQLTDNLDKIHKELMELKQVVGLGVPMFKKYNANARIKKGLRRGMGEVNVSPDL